MSPRASYRDTSSRAITFFNLRCHGHIVRGMSVRIFRIHVHVADSKTEAPVLPKLKKTTTLVVHLNRFACFQCDDYSLGR